MTSIDGSIISFVNSFAQRWPALDNAMGIVVTNPLIKGGLIAAMIWWAWFRPVTNRQILSWGIISGFLSLVVARTLAFLLPYRERPMHSPDLHFRTPYGANENVLIHWSSFPSDHAALFFALALSIFFVSRRAGSVALGYAFLVVCVPRVYMGFHYPSDILGGALVGMGVAALGQITSLRAATTRPILDWLEKSPGLFYAGFFILTFQITVAFDSIRQIVHFLLILLGKSLNGES